MALSVPGLLPPLSLMTHSRAPRGIGETVIDTPVTETPTRTSRPYWPALDGWRGLTIWFAISVHAGYFTAGGVLSLDTFFVLSGFLITGILLREWLRGDEQGRVGSTSRRSGRGGPDGSFPGCSSCSPRCSSTRRSSRRRSGSTACAATSSDRSSTSPTGTSSRRASRTSRRSPTVAGAPPVVARGRGAVLSLLAADRAGCAVARAAPVPCRGRGRRGRRRRGARRGRVRGADGVALRTGRRSVACVLRHRHPCAGDADRRGARGRRHAARAAAIASARIALSVAAARWLRRRRAPMVRDGRDARPRRLLRAVRPARVLVRDRGRDLASRATVTRAARARPRSWARSSGSARSPTRCTCGTGRSTSWSLPSGPGCPACRCSSCDSRRWSRSRRPRTSTSASPSAVACAPLAEGRRDRDRRSRHRGRRRRVRRDRERRPVLSGDVGQVADRGGPPPATTPSAPPRPRQPLVKVLVVGDSQAATLAQGLDAEPGHERAVGPARGSSVWNRAILGCSIITSTRS